MRIVVLDDYLCSSELPKLVDMSYGDIGYTVPFALSFDMDKQPYLNVMMPLSPVQTLLNSMMVLKSGTGCSDYYLDIGHVNYPWELERIVEGASPDLVRLESKIEYPHKND